MAASRHRQPSDEAKQRFVELWPNLRPSLAQSLKARMRDRMSGLEKFLADQADKETAVAAAYGWADLDLDHDFHDTPQGLRFTISEPARREVLGRLLALNHQRYEEEVKAGLHSKKQAKKGRKGTGGKGAGSCHF
jgi:hypothetical protein